MRDSVFIVTYLTGRAYWSNVPSLSFRHSITEEQFVAYVEYLIDSTCIYVSIGNRVYHRVGRLYK